MIVNEIITLSNKRFKVCLEGGISFILYKKELDRQGLKPGSILADEVWDEIKDEILLKRAKKRALHLLEKMNRSESNLRRKLREGFYPEDVIDQAIEYIKSFGYINDDNYAKSYIENKMHRKSRKEMYEALRQKGIDPDTIKESLQEIYCDEIELEAIKEIIRKKKIDFEEASKSDMNKLFTHLARKGFGYDSINIAIKKSAE